MHVQAMLNSHPQIKGRTSEAFVQFTEQCFDCAQACVACADACLAEEDLAELRQCIRLNLDCADICFATGALGTRHTGSDDKIVEIMLAACAEACHSCGAECALHTHHEHCRICAEVCSACERACRDAMRAVH